MLAQKTAFIPTEKGKAVDITDVVKEFVKKTRVAFGIVNVFAAHTTCSIILQENDRMLEEDLKSILKRAVEKEIYFHPDNSPSHLQSSILGSSVTIPITKGELNLGTWQSILLYEFDRTTKRKVVITVIGEVLEEHEMEMVKEKTEEEVL